MKQDGMQTGNVPKIIRTVETYHVPVLLKQSVDGLNIQPNGIYVDVTFGGGGHSSEILSRLDGKAHLYGFDQDTDAEQNVNHRVGTEKKLVDDTRFTFVRSNFRYLRNWMHYYGVVQIDGLLADLGVSSHHFDDESRGFSFRFDAPLDMRMDPTRGMSAAEWIATASEQDLHEVIKNYGEERFSRQIARAIVAQREESPIDTTRKLAQLVAQNVRTRERGQDPATRTFQAVRIFINRELEEVEAVLPQVAGRLKEGGRLAVIAFHSLEDRIVKQFIKKYSQHAPLPRWAVVKEADLPQPPLKAVGKAIKPGSTETEANPRARSAVLRVAERSSGEFSVIE